MDHLKEKSTPSLLCSLCSKCFCSEQRKTRGTGFSGHIVRNEQEPNTGNWGRGRGRKEMFADKPLDFESLHSPVNIHVATDCMARLVEQYWHVSIKLKVCFILRSHGWYVTRKLIFCGCCIFWSAKFALQCKSIFIDLFWNVKLFLWLNKGFRSFKLFSKVPPWYE